MRPLFVRFALLVSLSTTVQLTACKRAEEPSKAVYNPPPDAPAEPKRKDRREREKEEKDAKQREAKLKKGKGASKSTPKMTGTPAATPEPKSE